MGRTPHVLVIPLPGQQGHAGPLMKLALQIAANGVKVTFVNSEFTHGKIMAAMSGKEEEQSLISLVSIPDGLEMEDDRKDTVKFAESIRRVMPVELKKLIEKINQSNVDEQVTCIISDVTIEWALEVAKNMGIEGIAVYLAGPAGLTLLLRLPQLIEAGILGDDGTLQKGESISLSHEIPAWRRSDIPWNRYDPVLLKTIFKISCSASQTIKSANLILSNTFYELDPSAIQLIPNILPIGPLLASNHRRTFMGNFWPEDSTCLSWLDKQTKGSVIYVALGSTTVLSPQQVDELAFGLELTGHPFLWVVRTNLTKGSLTNLPAGFMERVADHGKIVEWAPQEKVLAHPSIACFLSHCGWNSTMESISMGVPLLCCPFFADQPHNRSYICDVWKIGLPLIHNENGIITRHEISAKIKTLISSDGIKANVLHLKEVARKSINEGGSSFKNFKSFIEHIKSL
ncbi:hypothetical protein REPUB_Repub07fG0049600 [Reevesia pubescens]